ncbi:MAG: tRNA (adenosine(37)-N6)-threonylcarbamoyltransferase complex dimerization subunit type 1 TsaB, partial [Candidatus Limnocylindrales bacterium]
MTGYLLAIDTATSQATLAIGDAAGALLGGRGWPAGHTHAETLLPALRELLAGMGLAPRDLSGVVVGTGPGGFTGLRVGLATAKTLAHGLGVPIVGVGTAVALAAAALGASASDAVVVMPAGPADCYLVEVHLEPDGRATTLRRPRLVTP